MTSSTNFNGVAMLPGAPYFYPTAPAQSTAKWLSEGHPNPDDQIPKIVGGSGFKSHTVADALKYAPDVRWPSEFPYQIPGFHPTAAAAAASVAATPSISEAYPIDPFPSTSMAQLPSSCCLNRLENNGNYYYPNAVLPSAYAPPSANDYFAATQHIAQWKVPAVTNSPLNEKKSGAVHSSSPPYRTGPGTNNVRVRTSEKYRMVYTDYQRLELEKEFRTSQFITSERKSQLSSELQLTERQIKIWFQNRRAKDRRENKKTRLL